MKKIRTNPAEIERIRMLVRSMSRDSLIYKALKEELSALGYWRNKKRGTPKGNRAFSK